MCLHNLELGIMEAKITKRLMDTLQPPESGQSFVWDTGIKGFGVRLTPNRKTYVVQARVKGKTVRVTLGAHGPLTPEQAREMAKAKLGEMAQGVNINQAQKAERLQNITLDEAFADYLKTRSLKPNTINDYHKAMRLGFDDWRNKPIRHISRDMGNSAFWNCPKPARPKPTCASGFCGRCWASPWRSTPPKTAHRCCRPTPCTA